MKKTLLLLGAEGGSARITLLKENGAEVFQVTVSEMFSAGDQESFSTKELAWEKFQKRVPAWVMLYPLELSEDLRPLVRIAYEESEMKDEYTDKKWQDHLA
ncbi:hypothetical protein GZH53_17325 [Flavihumibacter sp. R14]|nr:hypothetical protein [Flavihumibacter soli]